MSMSLEGSGHNLYPFLLIYFSLIQYSCFPIRIGPFLSVDFSGSNLSRGSGCSNKAPKTNWSQHANAHENFSRQNEFLSSNNWSPFPKYIDVNYIDGSNNGRWSSRDFTWTKELEANNKKVFGNHSFRPNQREVINATMSGNDVFVLMPTGGGKSLTYQLPALICPGLTLVISPLVSLIQDQIMHLLQANIQAAYLSGSMELTEQQEILRELSSEYCRYKLLYVTPEKIAKQTPRF